jgi:thymidylate synthase
LVRNGRVNAIVNMRSNDAVFGYKNDYHWQKYLLKMLVKEINFIRDVPGVTLQEGDIYWNVGSLHVYERHFYLIKLERWIALLD